jgi:hypothetical protein
MFLLYFKNCEYIGNPWNTFLTKKPNKIVVSRISCIDLLSENIEKKGNKITFSYVEYKLVWKFVIKNNNNWNFVFTKGIFHELWRQIVFKKHNTSWGSRKLISVIMVSICWNICENNIKIIKQMLQLMNFFAYVSLKSRQITCICNKWMYVFKKKIDYYDVTLFYY